MNDEQKRIHKFKLSIFNTVVAMAEKYNGKLTVKCHDGLAAIELKATYEYVPNVYLEWYQAGEYYRMYICLGNAATQKNYNGNYQAARIASTHAAAELVLNWYGFIFNNRANNKKA